jgi:hypothetical protein
MTTKASRRERTNDSPIVFDPNSKNPLDEEEPDWRERMAKAATDNVTRTQAAIEYLDTDLQHATIALEKATKKKQKEQQSSKKRRGNDVPTVGTSKKSRTTTAAGDDKQPTNTLARLSTSLKQKPLFVFAKYVAGFAGITNLEMLFDDAELKKEITTITVMSLSHLLLAALSDAGACLERSCKRLNIYRFDWKEVIMDGQHVLYEPFARLTAYYLRAALTNKPSTTTSLRHNAVVVMQTMQEELVFENTVGTLVTRY